MGHACVTALPRAISVVVPLHVFVASFHVPAHASTMAVVALVDVGRVVQGAACRYSPP
jgi:hypothetical protein